MSGKILSVSGGYIPSQTAHPAKIRVIFVLVAGGNNDYAAYEGEGEPEWVADHGNKMLFEEACMHFPSQNLEPDRYQR